MLPRSLHANVLLLTWGGLLVHLSYDSFLPCTVFPSVETACAFLLCSWHTFVTLFYVFFQMFVLQLVSGCCKGKTPSSVLCYVWARETNQNFGAIGHSVPFSPPLTQWLEYFFIFPQSIVGITFTVSMWDASFFSYSKLTYFDKRGHTQKLPKAQQMVLHGGRVPYPGPLTRAPSCSWARITSAAPQVQCTGCPVLYVCVNIHSMYLACHHPDYMEPTWKRCFLEHVEGVPSAPETLGFETLCPDLVFLDFT